jgi:hypothetical protein
MGIHLEVADHRVPLGIRLFEAVECARHLAEAAVDEGVEIRGHVPIPLPRL